LSADALRLIGLAFAAADLLIEIDAGGHVGLTIGGARAMLGSDEAGLEGLTWRALIAPDDQAMVAAMMQDLDHGQRRGPMLVRLARTDGTAYAEMTVRRPPDGSGLAAWALLAAAAPRNPPPGGLNSQAAFEDLTRSMMEAAKATGLDLELALVELSGLLSAAEGMPLADADALTARVSGVLRAESHRGIGAAKLGEERFAVVRRRGEDAAPMAERINRALVGQLGADAPVARVHTLPLDLSAGPAKTMRAIRFALEDFAREGLKDAPAATLVEAMNRSVKRTLARAGALGVAVTQRRFTLAYQPVADLADRSIHHYEVLVRFEDGASPFAMIQMAEEFDMIEELDHAILEQSVKRLIAPDAAALRLAVNVSGLTIVTEGYVDHVRKLLKAAPSARGRLIFEITESSAIDDLPRADRHIQSLRGMGSLVCLDDFGAGAASLAYLQQLKLDIVKIDGRYVRELANNGRDAALVRHLVKLCGELEVRTVAEMVETPEIEAVVKAAGVDFAQGWLYGKPLEQPLGLQGPSAARRPAARESWG
jgi:EAL domain-containing protein (putative c-di-GMP-specific phosphodiesterase class I)/GGDEF domain-containing protein